MKIRIFTAVAVLSLLAGSVFAGEVESVLTSDSTLWTVSVPAETTRLELTRRNGEVRAAVPVPTTEDEALESNARLAWDGRSNSLFVIWDRQTDGADEILVAALRADGTWTGPLVIAADGSKRAGLHVVLTNVHEAATDETAAVDTTLVHAAWWKISGDVVLPEYALVAFENGEHVSSDVSILSIVDEQAITEPEDTGDAIHPPLTMVRDEQGVEVIFGESDTTAVNRVKLTPGRIAANARMWRPGKSAGGVSRTPSARLVSENSEPVQAFMSNGRIVLYTPESQFRFVVFENGQWSPTRMIQLDESLTSDHLLRELRRTVDEQTFEEPVPVAQ